eukprot:gene6790-9303_t
MDEYSFSVIQKRSIVVKLMDLCGSMDLVVLLSADNLISLHRTMTWERILLRKTSEVGNGIVTAIQFNNNGKQIGIGFSNGDLVVLDIETNEFLPSFRIISLYNPTEINSLCWYPILNINKFELKSYAQIDHELVYEERIGFKEHVDYSMTDSEPIPLLNPKLHLDDSVLLSLRVDGCMCGHTFGIYPLFVIKVFEPFHSNSSLNIVSIIENGDSEVGICISSHDNINPTIANTSLLTIDGVTNEIRKNGKLLKRVCYIRLQLNNSLNKLTDLVTTCAKKWKECLKTIIPKLGLLEGLLQGYQIPMDPIQFFYTVASCGLWHPVAAATFTQHWNDQGLNRLKSAVDSTCRYIIKTIQLKMLPLAMNVSLFCRELIELNSSLGYNLSSTSNELLGLVSSEELLIKMDETLQEAKSAREKFASFVQFIKDFSNESNESSTSIAKIDLNSRLIYQKLFDQRVFRADVKGPKSQGECVTGTHLYSFLSDKDGLILKQISTTHNRNVMNISPHKKDLSMMVRWLNCPEELTPAKGINLHTEEFYSRSLFNQVKLAKEVLVTSDMVAIPNDISKQFKTNITSLLTKIL